MSTQARPGGAVDCPPRRMRGMKRQIGIAIAFAACFVAASDVAADEYRLQSLHIEHAFARATPPGAKSGGAYLTIENSGTAAATLVSASSPVAASVELHQMAMDGGLMTMRSVPALDIPPGGRVELRPGGYHLMLLDLKQPLKVGDKVPLTLTFRNLGSVDIGVEVEPMGASSPMTHK